MRAFQSNIIMAFDGIVLKERNIINAASFTSLRALGELP